MPALRRLGHRATVDEMGILDRLSTTQIHLAISRPTFHDIESAEDQALSRLNFAIDDRSSDAEQEQKISVPLNAILAEAL